MDELTGLLRANPQQVESITYSACRMQNAKGLPVGSDMFNWYGAVLAPVLKERGDLKDLALVMRDAQAVAEARGGDIPETIVERFVAAKAHTEELLAALVPSAAVQRRLREQEGLVARLLSLDDERLAAALPCYVGDLEPLLQGKGAMPALVSMLVALTGQDAMAPAAVLPALAAFWRERPLPTGEELFDFVASCARETCGGSEADWPALLRASLPVAPAGIGNRRQWVKHLNEYPAYLRYVRPHASSEDDARLSYDALERLFGYRLKQRDDRAALLVALPVLFAATEHLVGSRSDFVTLCDSMVPILAVQPLGGSHITMERLLLQIQEAVTLADLLAHYPGAPEQPKIQPVTPSMMLSNPSPEFERFADSFFGDPYMAWHDGLDTAALLALTGFERTFAEQLLLRRLEGGGDTRVAVGLGVLGLSNAVEPLRRRLATEGGNGAVEVAQALWRIARDPAAVQALLTCLSTADSNTRMLAAIALREADSDEVRQALWRAMDDDDSLVRHHAAESRLAMAGRFTVADSPDHPAIRVMHDDPEARRAAKAEIGRLTGVEGPGTPDGPAVPRPAGASRAGGKAAAAESRPTRRAADNAPPEPMATLRLALAQPLKVPPLYRNRWRDMIKVVKGDAPYLVFAGELIALLSGDARPRFQSDGYSGVGMFGGRNQHWLLRAGGIRLERRVEQEISDSWQRVEVAEDWFRVTGLPGTAFIDWDGDWISSMDITVGNVAATLVEPISKLANGLFEQVRIEQSGPSAQGPARVSDQGRRTGL
ncbi:MAG: HEAT repeat domain-containing protein [Anaerolineae bacterium]